MQALDAGIYTNTLLRYPLHMRVEVYRTRQINSVVYRRNPENEPVADNRALVSMGTL